MVVGPLADEAVAVGFGGDPAVGVGVPAFDIYASDVYIAFMLFEFIELPPFAAVREELFADEAGFAAFQLYLCHHPQAGDVIPGTDGCRKLRWATKGKGKRGGARVIYFLRFGQGQIVLVAAYGKGERDDVPRAWLRQLKEVFDREQSQKTRS